MALYMFGRANQAFGFHEEALDYFKQAYAIRRDIYEMSYYWAVSLVATEDYEAALERVEVPLQRISDWFEPYVLQAQAYFYLDELENAREAIELGSTKAKTVPELAESYYWQAIIYGEMGFVVVARNNWTELTNLDPEQVPIAYLQEAREHLNTLPTATSDDQITPTRVISGTATPTPTSTSTATATATPSPSPTP
jgi:tetratricopeptide (TPR) repeat protein